ncbi:MAG: sigma-70 family RNA polymerase sigma factor [Clostridia bacterium]|nr:sigma-70 family RNA polymerase sigma factor [Clostridia bacterium]
MDDIKLEQLIEENMKSIFGFALTRLSDVHEAEYLTSDILYALLRSAQNLRDETRFYGFMWKIAENTYAEYLRKKARNQKRFAELNESIADESDTALEEIIKKEELCLLRRELSLLSRQYRDTTVLYYIEKLSCSEISKRLAISTEMVKYYLFRARKIIREGMNMERLFGEKSYRPCGFEIDFWGTRAGDDYEYRDFQQRKIKGNILLAAYYTPVTLQEISVELGVSLPYLEDEVRLLLDRQYLVCKGDKYLTNIPIFTEDCTKTIDEKLRELTGKTAQDLIATADEYSSRFGRRFANENLMRWQKLLLCLHFSLIDTAHDLEKNFGELPSDGPYSLINGGGGSGVIWGRCQSIPTDDAPPQGIQGIYNGTPAADGKGSIIAMNFRQTLNAQHFEDRMTAPVVSAACGEYAHLSKEWQDRLDTLGYTRAGKPNFPVWTQEEYRALSTVLRAPIDIVAALHRRTAEIAATVTADLAPTHIRKSAAYVGALVYQFRAAELLANALYDMNWLTAVSNDQKPAFCVVTS